MEKCRCLKIRQTPEFHDVDPRLERVSISASLFPIHYALFPRLAVHTHGTKNRMQRNYAAGGESEREDRPIEDGKEKGMNLGYFSGGGGGGR